MTVILHALLLEIREVVESERLTLVAARAGQGATLNEAAAESHAELKDWMPWAQKVQSVDESEAYCREAQAKWPGTEQRVCLAYEGMTIDLATEGVELSAYRR